MIRRAFLLIAATQVLAVPALAGPVYGVQSSTGNILTIDPTTGAVLNSFAAPGGIQANDTGIGLSMAEADTVLLYEDSNRSSTLYRLDPATGAILSTATGDSFSISGLSGQTEGSTNYVFYAHTDSDLHRQTGYGGSESFFYGPGAPVGGVGGDDHGRLFANYSDGLIHELSLTDSSAGFLSGFAAPEAGLQGLAFDGTYLYASFESGNLYTLNADTGAVVRSVAVAGGTLYGLGASAAAITAVPEPASWATLTLGFGLVGAAARRRVRVRASAAV